MILKIFFPKICRHCQVFIPKQNIFCDSCVLLVKKIPYTVVKITETQSLKVHAGAMYDDPVKQLVLAKFYADRSATKDLARLILENEEIYKTKFDLIIPIPLHWARYAKRGYNQVDIIAKTLSKQLKIPVLKFLKRTKVTKFQSLLGKQSRQENVKEIFGVKKRHCTLINNKNVLIVDDLCTTGSTLKSAAILINKYHPTSIIAAVGCRAP